MVFPVEYFNRRKLHNIGLPEVLSHSRYRFRWVHWTNGADLVRAWAGVMLLKVAILRISPGEASEATVIATVAGVVLVGLGLKQILFTYSSDDFLAPFAYLTGLIFGLAAPQVAILGLVSGCAVAIGVGNLGGGLLTAGVATGVLGVMVQGEHWAAACPGLFWVWPAFAATMLHRRLVMAVRASPASVAAPVREIQLERRSS